MCCCVLRKSLSLTTSLPPTPDVYCFVPQASNREVERDFVRQNAEGAAAKAKAPWEPVEEKQYKNKAEYGKVPKYIQQRKLELAQVAEHKKRMAELEDVPVGMKLVDEEDRLHTLHLLKLAHADTEKELQALPFVVKTNSHIKHKAALEEKLQELEESIKIFSRSTVYVKAD